MSFSEIVLAVFEKNAKNRKSSKKDVKFTLFGAISRTPQGYLGYKIGITECPIVIRRYMQSLVKIVRAEITKKAVFVEKTSPTVLSIFFSSPIKCIQNYSLKF